MSDAPRVHPRASTPTVLQMEAVECGAACLKILLEHFGKVVPLPELRIACGVSRDGSKASNLVKAAKRYGLKTRAFKKKLDSIKTLKPPMIVFWNFKHFLIVEGWDPRRQQFLLNDPASGHRTVSLDEFDGSFTGVTIVCEPGPDFEPGGRRPTLRDALAQRLRGSWTALSYALLAGVLLAIPGLVLPAFTQVFVDQVLASQRLDWTRPLLLAMALGVVAQLALHLLQRRILRRVQIQLGVRLSSQFAWHLLQLPPSYYAQRYSGEIAGRTQLNERVVEVVSGQIAITAIGVVTMTLYAALMASYDLLLTSVGLAAAAVELLALRALERRRVEENQRLQQDYGKVGGETIAALQSMETLKSAGHEDGAFARFAGHYVKASNARHQLDRSTQTLSALPAFLSALTTALILGIGGLRVVHGHLTLGMLVAFQAIMTAFLRPITDLVNLGTALQDLRGDLERLDDVLHNPTDPDPHPDPRPDDPTRLQGTLTIRDLSFGYSPLEKPLLQGLDLHLEPGQRLALVGGSGSGKSTIAALVCGLQRPWDGEVLFDGRTRAQLPRDVLARSLAFVSQDLAFFAGSVRDNLTLWDPSVPDEHVLAALEDAAVLPVVLALPGGLDAQLTEGAANLSGGQRQRLEIARALVLQPSILVLDEATSALDTETEQHIDRRLRLRGCTCLLVAHRLSTIRDCDEIVVLERGKIVERGRHDDLWAADGPYARLLRSDGALTEAP